MLAIMLNAYYMLSKIEGIMRLIYVYKAKLTQVLYIYVFFINNSISYIRLYNCYGIH